MTHLERFRIFLTRSEREGHASDSPECFTMSRNILRGTKARLDQSVNYVEASQHAQNAAEYSCRAHSL